MNNIHMFDFIPNPSITKHKQLRQADIITVRNSHSPSVYLLSECRCLHWTGRPCVPFGGAAVSRRGSDICARAAANTELPAPALHRGPEYKPAGAPPDSTQHFLSSAAV